MPTCYSRLCPTTIVGFGLRPLTTSASKITEADRYNQALASSVLNHRTPELWRKPAKENTLYPVPGEGSTELLPRVPALIVL
jgi:hypothetical protein